MECTQRLECTQELYDTHTERVCPEQIGFLGICGTKHPVMKGPNKIGRDLQTCNIVLNLNSVSRQHAVINILNSREYMLMDLDSANKTKLQNKTLQPYIPHPLKKGDVVQFGDIFGVFQLLEENDDLPMTQALDIPDTPLPSRHMTKFKAPITLIPESPDVSMSDKDTSFDNPSKEKSFIQDSQTKKEKHKLSNSQFITPFGKSIPIQPVSSPRTDSKQTSRSSISLNESLPSNKSAKFDNIHDMDTQPPQINVNDSTDSIYSADTQIPEEHAASPSIHSLDTQLPVLTLEHFPQVQKIHGQHEMQFDLYAANKENDISIFNADTQPFADKDAEARKCEKVSKLPIFSPKDISREKLAPSDEELLFDEIDGDHFEEDFNSQAILPPELPLIEDSNRTAKAPDSMNFKECTSMKKKYIYDIEKCDSKDFKPSNSKCAQKSDVKPSRRDVRIQSDDSTDCEDLVATQKIPELPIKVDPTYTSASIPLKRVVRIKSDSSTDCEDIDMIPTQQIPELSAKNSNKEQLKNNVSKAKYKPVKRINRINSDSSTDCEDMIPTQILSEIKSINVDDLTNCEENIEMVVNKSRKPNKSNKNLNTKLGEIDTIIIESNTSKDQAFEDMATQIIETNENDDLNKNEDDIATQIIEVIPSDSKIAANSFQDFVSPFKVPLQSPVKMKTKDISKSVSRNKSSDSTLAHEKFYKATQDIYNDLCSQRPVSPEIVSMKSRKIRSKSPHIEDDEIMPCSVEDYKVGDRFANISPNMSPKKKIIRKYITNLSTQEVREIIGVESTVTNLKRIPSDVSDEIGTPKKVQLSNFMDIDLPNSQEIKTTVTRSAKLDVTESSSESETEKNSEEQYTPILYRKKKPIKVTKIDLTKKFEVEKLPERVITRVRKPTAKVHDAEVAKNILKSKFLPEQEDQIDNDIIIENITRLKNSEKCKKSDKMEEQFDIIKENKTLKKPDSKSQQKKEKIKVKIEKPKKKETKSKSETSNRKSDENNKVKSIEQKLDLTTDLQTSRNTRSRKKESDSQETENKSVSSNNSKSKPTENKKTPQNNNQDRSKSPEIEIRRSKRQQSAKQRKENDSSLSADEPKLPKSILKKSPHEQSAVYNISSSSAESPKSLKRSAINDSEVPSPKRTRATIGNTANTGNTSGISLRATPARMMKTQHVLFTAFPSEEVKQKLEKLGAVTVTDVKACSVVLTMQVKRTFKLLCCVGLGRPIAGPAWVQACVDSRCIVDPWLYLIKDESAEKRFQFSLEKTLKGKRNYLKGYNVSSTPSVQPNATEMKLIVECSGGAWREGGPNWVCVSSSADRALWPDLRRRGAVIVSTELILGGVLRQRLDIDATDCTHSHSLNFYNQ